MIRMAGRLISLCAAVGLTLLATSEMTGIWTCAVIMDGWEISAPNYIRADGRTNCPLSPLPRLTLFKPHMPLIRAPKIVCEPVAGDPEAATDCDAAAQKG
jgi:hypothetical protein